MRRTHGSSSHSNGLKLSCRGRQDVAGWTSMRTMMASSSALEAAAFTLYDCFPNEVGRHYSRRPLAPEQVCPGYPGYRGRTPQRPLLTFPVERGSPELRPGRRLLFGEVRRNSSRLLLLSTRLCERRRCLGPIQAKHIGPITRSNLFVSITPPRTPPPRHVNRTYPQACEACRGASPGTAPVRPPSTKTNNPASRRSRQTLFFSCLARM